jgi:TM2 domain-containing membrane protein YozV
MDEAALAEASNKKLAAGLSGIFLGFLGIHKFVLGYTTAGVIMLVVTLVTCGLGGFVMGIIGLIEGIIYLTKTPEEFQAIYIDGRKAWF